MLVFGEVGDQITSVNGMHSLNILFKKKMVKLDLKYLS